MPTYNRREAWLFRAGDYPATSKSPRVVVDSARLQRIVDHTNSCSASSLPVLDLDHWPTENLLDFGRLVPGSLHIVNGAPTGGAHGDWAVGEVALDAEIDSRLAHRGLSVLLDTATDTFRKIAVTATPRVRGAQFSNSTEGDNNLVAFTEGSIMADPVGAGAQPNAAATNPAHEGEPTEGMIARLAAALLSPFAAVLGNRNADPEPVATVAAPDPEVAALKAQLATHEATIAKQSAEFAESQAVALAERVKARTAEFVAAGVQPYLARLLVPFACGAEKATVAFSGEDAPTDRGFAEVAAQVLEASRGAVPMARILPTDDSRITSVNGRIEARADELRKADKDLSFSAAMERAALEVS